MNTDRMSDRIEQIDGFHRQQMETFADETHEEFSNTEKISFGQARRRLITRTGAGVAALSFGRAFLPLEKLMPAAYAQGELSDVDIAVFAESVELAAVAAYAAAVNTNLLSDAAVEIGTAFSGHHTEHAGVFAAAVGDAATGEANQAVLDVFAPMITEAADEAALLAIALELEEGAAATYHLGLGLIQDPAIAKVPATILPVESMHAVALAEVLELDTDDYLPAFETSKKAIDPAEFPVNS